MDESSPSESPRPHEAQLASLLRALPALLWTTDCDLRLTSAEGEGTDEALHGRPVQALFDSEDAAAACVTASRRALAGESVELEVDRDSRTLQLRLAPWRGERGELLGTMGVALDVTDRRRAEQALVQRTETLLRYQRVIVELARSDEPDFARAAGRILETDAETLRVERVGLWIFDEARTQLTCPLLYSASQHRHRPGTTLQAVDYPAYFRALAESRALAVDDARADPRTREFAAGYLRPKGITSLLDVPIWSRGQIVGIVCHEHVGALRHWTLEEQEFAASIADMVSVALEARERHRAQQALRANEARLQLLIRQVPGVLWTTDRALRVTELEGSLLPQLGWTPESACGVAVATLFDAGTTEPALLEAHERALQEQASDVALEWRGGFYQVRVEPLYDAAGDTVGTIGIALDTTARRQAEEGVRRLTRELESRVAERTAELEVANRDLEAFNYSVSHDLRAPLRSVDGFSEALVEGYADRLDATGRDYLRRVRDASRRMSELIEAILDLARLGRVEVYRERVDLSALAHAVVDELRRTSPAREVEVVIAPGLEAVGDARLLRVLLENLLGNAWKFTRHHTHARIEFGVTEHEGRRVFFVRDNGAGFDMAYADRLFTAFQRLHGAHEFEGTGIGLATVQRIVRRHGGELWAEGAVDQGATFYFTL
jgi:PAS domain S-box-containing protein